MSVAFCAIAVTEHNTMAATDSRDVTFKLVHFRFAIFFPLMRSPKSKVRFVECGRISAKAQRRSVTTYLDNELGERFGRFLRQIVAYAARSSPVCILARESICLGTGIRMWSAIGITFKGNGGHGDDW